MVGAWSVDGLVVRAGGFAVGPVDLALDAGASVAVVGRSGAGKTTFLRGLAGLAPVVAGRVLRDGVDLTDVPPERRGIGYVPQGLGLLPHRSVERNIAYPLELRGAPTETVLPRLMERFGIAALAGRRPSSLSTGEQQRVAMARALAAGPSLLVWDEPLGGLDVSARDDLLSVLEDVQRTERIPLLLVTHDPTAAFTAGDRLLILHEGKVLHVGPAARVAEAPTDAFVARFVGFDNVLSADELARAGTGPLRRWLSERSGPGGIAFPARAARWAEGPASAPFTATVRRLSPGPGGLMLLARSDGIALRLAAPRGRPIPRAGEAVGFDLDPAELVAIPHRSSEEGR